MDMNRRTLLASGTALTGLSVPDRCDDGTGREESRGSEGRGGPHGDGEGEAGTGGRREGGAPRPGLADPEGTGLLVLQPPPVEVRPDRVHVLRAMGEQGSSGRPREDSSHEGAGAKLKDRTEKGGGAVVYELLE